MRKSITTVLALLCALVLAACDGSPVKAPDTSDDAGSFYAKESEPDTGTSSETTMDYSEIPGATRHIVDIWDRTEEEQLDCADAVEKFYEDETAEYYFGCVKSQHIIVMDNTGMTKDIVSALNEGLATISDLDHYGIEYYTEPKSEIGGIGTDYPEQELSEPESYAFEAQYIRTDGYSGDRSYPYHAVIDSREELDAYYEANRELFDLEPKAAVYSDSTVGFLDACGKYDDSYFEVQNLVLIVLEEGSGSIRHEITDVRPRRDESGASLGWDISVDRTVPEVVTDDMAQWHLFLEVEMGNVIKDGDNIWINGELSGPPQP